MSTTTSAPGSPNTSTSTSTTGGADGKKHLKVLQKRANLLIESLRKQKLLIGKGGLYGNVLRIAPPMLVEESQIEEALAKLDRGLTEVAAMAV